MGKIIRLGLLLSLLSIFTPDVFSQQTVFEQSVDVAWTTGPKTPVTSNPVYNRAQSAHSFSYVFSDNGGTCTATQTNNTLLIEGSVDKINWFRLSYSQLTDVEINSKTVNRIVANGTYPYVRFKTGTINANNCRLVVVYSGFIGQLAEREINNASSTGSVVATSTTEQLTDRSPNFRVDLTALYLWVITQPVSYQIGCWDGSAFRMVMIGTSSTQANLRVEYVSAGGVPLLRCNDNESIAVQTTQGSLNAIGTTWRH